MAILGPFSNVPTGAVYVLQSTGTKGDIVLAPINFQTTGIYTGTIPNGSLQRFFLTMGG
jgi:hypothetical protein